MARKDTATDTTHQQIADLKGDPVNPNPTTTLDIADASPGLSDGHDEIVEEAQGIDRAAEIISPMGGRVLYDGVDGESIDGIDGEVHGSTLFDDLAGDLSNPTDDFDGMSDGGGGMPAIDDQSGWTMDLPSLLGGGSGGQDGTDYDDDEVEHQDGREPQSDDDDEVESQDGNSGDGDDDGVDEDVGQDGNAGMPAPDDGTGGDPDADDFIGGRGDVDPAPETEDHGGGELIGGRGDVDPAPETEDQGGAGGPDMIALGLGAVDPLDGGSTLLGGDTGDLAEMASEADLGDIEVEFDDSLVDADMGEDV